MDFICGIFSITDTHACSRCRVLPYIHWSSRNCNLLCADNDSVYVDCKRSVVLTRISIKLHSCTNLDSICYADGFGILGNKEEQTLSHSNGRCTLWNVSATVQHDKSHNNRRSARDCVQIPKDYITSIHDSNRTSSWKVL